MTSTFVQKRHELLVDRIDRFAVLLDLSKESCCDIVTLPEWTLIGMRKVYAEREDGHAQRRKRGAAAYE